MVHSGATGLVDDWRMKVRPSHSPPPLQFPTLDPPTPDRHTFPYSPMISASSMSTLSSLSVRCPITQRTCPRRSTDLRVIQFEEVPLPGFAILKAVPGQPKVSPGIRNLPAHIRPNFRNEFIRFVMKQTANSQSPWTNPDVDALQAMYQIVYPIFPARIRQNDAVFNPVSNSLTAMLSNLDCCSLDHHVACGPPEQYRFHRHRCRPATCDQYVPQEPAQHN